MPRDLSGNMTLPAGNPVVTGTSISSSVYNATVADLAAEIQDSLSRSGEGGMLAAFKNADGAEAAPGITFTSETGTGWFRYAAGVVRMSILGAWKFAFQAAGLIIKGTLGLMDPAGTNKTITLAPPTGLAADYTLTMPTALPAATGPVTVTAAGQLAASPQLSVTAASGTAITGQGQAAGTGVTGTGGATAGGATYETAAGVVGNGGSGGAIGVVGNGSGSFTGVVGVGGASNGTGVAGVGSGTGAGVRGSSSTTGGTGVEGWAGATCTGYGGEFTGNATRAPLRLVPQAAPSTAQEGDIYFDSSGVLKIYDGASWLTVTAT